MILCGSTSTLHFYSLSTTPKLLSHFSHCSFLSTSSPFARICLIRLNQSYGRRIRAFSGATVAVSVPKKTGRDTFLAEESVSWKSLGLSDRISQALSNAGFDRPSLVQGWPVNKPDIIVSTPVALLNNIDPKKNHGLDFIRGVKYVVFDEADMLLCGGFQNHVIRLIHMLRFDEKLLSRMNKSGSENPVELNSDSLSQFDFEGEEDIQNESISESEEISEDDVDAEDLTEKTKTLNVKKKDWRRVRKNFERSKQYIFVAATLPDNGKKTAGAVLKKMFPDANWVSGNYLHYHNPRLKEKWIEVTIDTQVDALIEAVKQFNSKALDHGADVSRTMVFGNTVEAVLAVANILQRAGIECYRYHKDLSLEERAETLDDFRKKGGIFVCTDAAARGVDIPNVSHVIQADFATSAVDFLHRVGRTARAGQFGVVTSLYTESNRDLVNAIQKAEKLGQPVEAAFSRKRSFRNKLKKRAGSNKAEDISKTELMV
ncbi:DEAD-box ATP-dependent RNA helicase 22 isoform X3 [Durio zibethinus]|uniref:DEAD-box ATP-dependent RNA helicase 22 isoform X3 n=1 Tax=Durio zibethinus TaxID=66656 RepID=A0A6P5XDB7_DURZI|nr:DEAD-box ATP-dependent RNA helicase 22 isoform X3 [Durio zibethinus]